MKSFTEKLNEDIKPYEEKDIRSVIYKIIDENISLNNSDNVLSISGKKELTEKIYELLSIENLKETLDTYKEVYDNPDLLNEIKKPKINKKGIKTDADSELEKDEKDEKKEDKEIDDIK